jgi:hypothetical protein
MILNAELPDNLKALFRPMAMMVPGITSLTRAVFACNDYIEDALMTL